MAETLEKRLSKVLSDMPSEDVHAVAAFAEFLTQRRQTQRTDGERKLTDEEHTRIVAALDGVVALSMEEGPSVSNRDHDKYLYGGE